MKNFTLPTVIGLGAASSIGFSNSSKSYYSSKSSTSNNNNNSSDTIRNYHNNK